MIPFSRPGRAPRAEEYLRRVLDTGRLQGDGEFTRAASARLSELLGGAPVLLTPSCTAALEMAAILMDVGPGDEVVLPSYTFPSTATAFALRGARLVFADVDPETWCMGPEQAAAAMTPATRVVVAVHYGGVAADPAGLAARVAAAGARLVEDAAQGLFAGQDGRALGTFGALGCLSFHATKNVTSGEGGALVLCDPDPALRRRAEVIREKGTDRARFLRGEVDKYTWRDVGGSWLMSELQAAVLAAQLEAAPAWQALRRRIWDTYDAALRPASGRLGIRCQGIPAGAVHPAHLYALLAPEDAGRDRLIAALRAADVHAVSHFEPLHSAPAGPGAAACPLPVTDAVAARLVRLPLHPEMTVADAAGIAARTVDAILGLGRAGA